MKPPYWPAWLVAHADRQCGARSKRAGRQCQRIATPGYRVCATHGSKSRGRLVIRWDCRPSALQEKAERVRQQWMQRGSGSVPPESRSSTCAAYEMTAGDIEALLASKAKP